MLRDFELAGVNQSAITRRSLEHWNCYWSWALWPWQKKQADARKLKWEEEAKIRWLDPTSLADGQTDKPRMLKDRKQKYSVYGLKGHNLTTEKKRKGAPKYVCYEMREFMHHQVTTASYVASAWAGAAKAWPAVTGQNRRVCCSAFSRQIPVGFWQLAM